MEQYQVDGADPTDQSVQHRISRKYIYYRGSKGGVQEGEGNSHTKSKKTKSSHRPILDCGAMVRAPRSKLIVASFPS